MVNGIEHVAVVSKDTAALKDWYMEMYGGRVVYDNGKGTYFLQFADGTHDYGKALRSALAQKKYDYVVLQDAGGATADATDEALSTLIPLVEENGARPLLYMRYSDKTDDSARIADTTRHVRTYTSMAEKYGVPAAPAAVAFREAIQAGYGKALYGITPRRAVGKCRSPHCRCAETPVSPAVGTLPSGKLKVGAVSRRFEH